MEQNETIKKIVRTGFFGGIISIVLSPIAIMVSYYMGSSLNGPKVEIKYALVRSHNYQVAEDLKNPIPDSILHPFVIDLDLYELLLKIQDPNQRREESILDDLRNNNIYNVDVEDLVKFISLAIEVIKTKPNIQSRDAKISTLTAIRNYLNSPEISKENEPTIFNNTYFEVGLLNTGQTDDVVLPEGKVHFLDNDLIISNSPLNGYTVIKPHSFEHLNIAIDTIKSTREALDKWKAIIKQKSIIEFTIQLNTTTKDLKFKSRIEPL